MSWLSVQSSNFKLQASGWLELCVRGVASQLGGTFTHIAPTISISTNASASARTKCLSAPDVAGHRSADVWRAYIMMGALYVLCSG